MVAKAVLFVCAQALVLQSIAGQCIEAGWGAAPWGFADGPCDGLGAGGWGTGAWGGGAWGGGAWGGGAWGAGPAAAAASHGGGLLTGSASPIAPSGISLVSENVYEGALAVAGAVPFLGTVGLEGALPTSGAGAVAYGCGNGEVAMLSEDIGAAGGFGYGAGALGYGAGALGCGIGAVGYDAPFARGGCGCGCGAFI